MADYDGADDYQDRWRNTRDSERPPPPYPPPGNADYDPRGRGPAQYPPYGQNGGMPPPPAGGPPGIEVPPPPIGERRPSALKRPGSRNRVPNVRPEFQDDLSYVGSTAPDLEAKNRAHHRQFRDKRDGYESDEGEMHRKMRSRGDYDEPEPRRRGQKDPYDDRGPPPPRSRGYDDEEPEPRHRSRRDRDYDRGYDDDPPSRHRRRDPPGVEYGAAPIPAVRRSQTDRSGRRPKPRKDDYDDESSDDDRRRPPPSRRRSQDDTHRRRRDYDDDRDDYRDDRSRRDDRDRNRDRDRDRDRDDRDRRRDKSRDRRSRYSDDDDDYRDRRDRDRRRGSSAPPKEVKIGDYDIGPWIQKGKKHYGTLAPVLAPIAMQMARKYMSSDRKR